MKNILKKIFIILASLSLSVGTFIMPAMAAETATVTISDKTAAVGDEVSIAIKVKGTDVCMCDLWITYDSNILQAVSGFSNGGGGTVRILSTEATSFTVVFKAINPGSSKISLSASSIISSIKEDSMTINAGVGSIVVSAPSSYSSNCGLSSLNVSPGTLSPAFSTNTISYTTSVGSDCTKLIISAIAEDLKSTVKVAGTKMDIGANTTTITVTAQNGTTKSYVISTMKDAGAGVTNPTASSIKTDAITTPVVNITAIISNQTYNINSDLTKHTLPAGYVETEIEYNGQTVIGAKGANGLTIMYLVKQMK